MGHKLFFFCRSMLYSLNGFIFIFLYLCGCSKGNEPEDKSKNFGIYLLDDPSITWENLKTINLDSLKLKEWITGDMIDFYDYSSHVIYLNVDYNTLFNIPHNDNTPFVVVANNKRCYYGRFNPPADTTQPHVVIKPMKLCNDMVILEFNPPNRKDLRADNNIKSALKDAGKFKAGLYMNFRYLELYTVVLKYTNIYLLGEAPLEILEDDILYLYNRPDYIKVGNDVYRSKIVMYNQDSYFSFQGVLGDTSIHKVITLNVERTNDLYILCSPFSPGRYSFGGLQSLFQKGSIKEGVYNCYIEYYGIMGGDKNKRYTPKGRMWIGYLRTNTINITYDSTTGIKINNMNVELE